MNSRLRSLLYVSALLSSLISVTSYAEIKIEGIFKGSISLNDKKTNIPLQISLALSEEIEVIETSTGSRESRVIDGAFSLDDEGGPYPFSKISYDIDTNTFDLRYSREAITPEDRAPTGLRFTGRFASDGSLTGRVVSGSYGVIGTFEVKPTEELMIELKNKYVGKWIVSEDSPDKRPFKIVLEPLVGNHPNPINWELGFTPAKIGSFEIAQDVQDGFTRVSIDYIRKNLLCVTGDSALPGLSLVCTILNEQQDLSCVLSSVYGGKKANLKFKKVPYSRVK